jgi:2-polyprenyl-3-methyl-5-hydroxy-6-metoxy-1,4-benzoquinol methylase
VEERANRQFVELEQTHFWLVSRRRIFMDLLDRELAVRTGLRVIDVGCGAGGMLGPLSRYGAVKGLDTSAELVEFCRTRGFADVAVASAYALPVEAESADLITLFDIIEHVPDDERVLRECRRVLSPGGLVFISVPAYQLLYANNDRVAHHQRRYTGRQLRRKLLATGFVPVRVTYFNTLLFPAILPTVLAKKVIERMSDPGDTTNLSHQLPPLLNRALTAIMSGERHLLSWVSFPFGHSIIAMARPRGAPPRLRAERRHRRSIAA